jgi:hypothetical protein
VRSSLIGVQCRPSSVVFHTRWFAK